MTCHDVELSLGVLVLGAIDPGERAEVEAHLATCPRCTAVLAELAPLPGLLHRLDPAAAVAPHAPLPPLHLRRKLLEAARDQQRRQSRRRRLVAVTAAAAVLLGIVLGVTVPRVLDGRPASGAVTASAVDARTDVRADLRLVPGDTGTELTLRLAGVAPGQRCRLVVVDASGRRDVAATWVASYAGRASVTGHTGVRHDRIQRLDVVTTDGRTLVRVPVSHA